MTKIKLDYQTAKLFEKLMRQGYIVENGKDAKRLVTALRGNLPYFYAGWDRRNRKTIVLIEQIPSVRRYKTLRNIFYRFNY